MLHMRVFAVKRVESGCRPIVAEGAIEAQTWMFAQSDKKKVRTVVQRIPRISEISELP